MRPAVVGLERARTRSVTVRARTPGRWCPGPGFSRPNGTRQRRKDWEQIVAAYRQSGLTQEAFARRQGMPVGTLRAWIYRRAGRRAPRLLPVRVRAMAPEIAVELRLPSGVAM